MARYLLLSFLWVGFAFNSLAQAPKSNIVPVVQSAHSDKIEFYDVWNEKHLLLTTSKNEIILWNTQTNLQLRKILTPNKITGAVLTKNGEEIAVLNYATGKDASLRFYNTRNGKLTDTLAYYSKFGESVYWKSLDLLVRNKNGSKLALKAFNEVFLVDPIKKNKNGAFKAQAYSTKISFTSQENELLIGYTTDGSNRLEIITNDGKVIKSSTAFAEEFNSIVEGGNTFFALGRNGSITEFNHELTVVNSINPIGKSRLQSNSRLILSNDGKRLIVPLSNDKIVYDLTQKAWINKSRDIYEPIIAINADATQLAVLSNAVDIIQPITGNKLLIQNAAVIGLEGLRIVPKGDVISTANGYSRLLNLQIGNQIEKKFEIKEWISDSLALCFDKNGYINTDLQIRNVYTEQVVNQINKEEMKIENATISPDFKTIAFSHSLTNKLYLASGSNYTTIKAINNPINEIRYFDAKFSPNSDLLTVSGIKQIGVYDIKANKWILGADELDGYGFSDFAFTPDNKSLLYGYLKFEKNVDVTQSFVNEIREFDFATKTSKTRLKIESSSVCEIICHPKENIYVLGYVSGLIEVRSLTDNSIIFSKNQHSSAINGLAFHPNGRWLIAYANDKIMSVNDFKLNKSIISATKLYGDNKAGIALFTADNYYMVPSSNAAGIHYVEGFNTYSFKQFDYRFNRPDKVLQSLGSPDTALINSYKKAYEKRIKKLGIDTTLFTSNYSVPEADFINREEISFERRENKLLLKIRGNDKNVNLDRFNVWINEVPIYGLKGVNLRTARRKSVDTTITVILAAGDNKIETSVINTNGIESYRLPLMVNYNPTDKPNGKMYFLGVGINNFAQAGHNLQWSVKDIRDLAIKLKEKYLENIEIDTLFDDKVTIENILALKTKLKKSEVDDKVIIAYSGHGLLSASYDYFLSTYDIDFNKPEKNGMAYDSFEDLVDNIPARQKLMLIDACHSGEVDKEELQKMNKKETVLATIGIEASAEGTKADATGKGVVVKNLSKNSKLGMKNSFELMQDLFANIGKGTGATIISAAGGMQYALEKNSLKNGVFTYSILEYMKETKTVGIKKLKDRVNDRVVELTAGLQQPTSRSENTVIDWAVW
ncbi:hypothetical protein FA048_16735 [Pedobacter polaris]|uniref:Peptidase C14 caspase domain-containing protein n=1 Tax=Pedobacter polaris TaxID=2571273 RepID=A0A4U1CG39_9SPHI|nr:caspase family protein [Pedobacter polaris]TKC05375.1 hypothetical protein FA048_16735 [Pedobacter polaris]